MSSVFKPVGQSHVRGPSDEEARHFIDLNQPTHLIKECGSKYACDQCRGKNDQGSGLVQR